MNDAMRYAMMTAMGETDPEWDNVAENGSSELDPLNILQQEEADRLADLMAEEADAVDQYTSDPIEDIVMNQTTTDSNSPSIIEQIATAEETVEMVGQDLLKVRAEGKEQHVIANSKLTPYRDRLAAQAKVTELLVDMRRLQEMLKTANENLRNLQIQKLLMETAALALPVGETPVEQRVAAIFLTSGLNGLRRSLFYNDQRLPKLEDKCARDKLRARPVGQVYDDALDQLEELYREIEAMQVLIEWATGPTMDALAAMKTTQFWNPSIQDPSAVQGTPVDNATPFD